MADRYPNDDYGRGDMSRGRFGRWNPDEERRFGGRGRRQERGSSAQDFDQDFDRDGSGYTGAYGGYGGGYGAGYGGAYAGGYGPGGHGYGRGYESERNYGQRYGQGGMRGQSYGGYRERGEWDRDYGLQGSGYDQRSQGHGRGRQGWSGPGGDINEQGWGQRSQGGVMGQGWGGGQDHQTGLGAGGYYIGRQSFQGQGYQGQGYQGGSGYRDQGGYGQMQTGGFGNQTGWNEGGSFGQGRPGMGAQGYERASQDYGGYEGSFGQGGFLSRGGRTQWGRHSGRGPKNYTRSDDRIREDINDRLTEDPEIDATDIEVKVSNCEVTLTGAVESREEKRRAEDCAESVSGVKNVQNNLRVQPSGEDETPRTTGGKKGQRGASDTEQRMQ